MRAFVFILFIAKVFGEDCSLDVSDPQSPFIVTDELKFPTFAEGANQTITFGNDIYYAVCPRGTHSPYLEENGSKINCQGGTEILILHSATTVDFGNIKCTSPGATNLKKTNTKCATSRTLFDVGFNVDTEFLAMATVCFDEKLLTPIYCQFENDKAPDETDEEFLAQSRNTDSFYESYICNGTACSWGDGGDLFSDVSIDNIYVTQADILDSLIGSHDTLLLKFPLTATNLWYLNVANDGQEIQKAPYFDYINVVPLWNTDLVDVFLYFLDTTLGKDTEIGSTVTIGTWEVTSLNNNDGKSTEIYLNDGGDKVPVPKWIWVLLDKLKQVVFYYNGLSSEEGDNEIVQICSYHRYMLPNIFACTYDNVTNSDLSDIINDLSQNDDIQ